LILLGGVLTGTVIVPDYPRDRASSPDRDYDLLPPPDPSSLGSLYSGAGRHRAQARRSGTVLSISGLEWAVTIGAIGALLALDLTLAALRPHRVGFREALGWSVFYVAVALLFGAWLWTAHGAEFGTEYLAGYVVEKSLSVDNLFVFVIIMTTFAVPERHQHKALTFGIVLALAMRAIFIALGATLLSLFSFMFLIFGGLLIYTAVQLFRHRDEDPDIEDNAVVKTARRLLPVSDDYVEGRLVARIDGRRVVTPLFIVLVAIGGIDLLFALDSIPAVFGVTQEAYIVFAANAFALLGLRALFFLVKGLLDRLVYLSTGLSLILAFIGVKLILHWLHVDISASVPEISTPVSLGVIVVVLAVVTVASLVKTRRDPTATAHPGSLKASRKAPAEQET
jgi:tellurite resistance protein TerC